MFHYFQVLLVSMVITFYFRKDFDTQQYETSYGDMQDLYDIYSSDGKI